MASIADNNKRIAKNTLLLYFRMLFLMAVSLYTSRVILNALGVEDYGIYNVVGGVVAMFSMISGTLSAAISRFITFELGKKDKDRLKVVFSSSVTIQLGLAFLIILFAEPIGIWFLNYKMVIPIERLEAANYVLQLSIVNFVINLISIPYNATIIAHERMSAFAYISIAEALGKLLIAYMVVVSPIDKLVFYAILMCIVSIVIRLIYGAYCKKHFEECNYHFAFDKSLLRRMFGFAGWNFIGASSGVLRDQGGNLLINLFAGPSVNAARGIAMQVNSAIASFVTNFMTALNPQIIKSYAAGDYSYMMTLIMQGARLSFYMLLLLSLPVLICTHYILSLWLGVVPDHTVLFIQLVLILSMSESISYPLITAMLATGHIRNYQIVVGGLQLLNLPLSYALLRMGYMPEIIMVVAIFISQCCLVARLYMLRALIHLQISLYMKKVYFNILLVTLFALIIPMPIRMEMEQNFFSFVLLSSLSVVSTFFSIYWIGCNERERRKIKGKMKQLKMKAIK